MALPQIKQDDRFTYADYMTWDDDQRWELIDGQAFCMTPAPARLHQEWLGNLFSKFHVFLAGKPCKVYISPFDVRFSEHPDASDEDIDTVVQPDMVVFCDKSKLDDRGAKGAPDLLVEILSPGTSKRDITIKFELYQRHGVKEYWILYPNEKLLQLYRLGEDKKYGSPQVFGPGESVQVAMLGELEISLDDLFSE